MGDFVVLIRIFLGWLGVYLLSKGAPPELVSLITDSPEMVALLTGVVSTVVGAALAGLQLIWWKLAKKMGWST